MAGVFDGLAPAPCVKATAVAHPIQGLVKYHGLRDPVRRIPFHDSISVCTGPISTTTTVAVLDSEEPCTAVVDGEPLTGRALERVLAVVDAVREQSGDDRPFRMESRSDFPQQVGLGSSSSGFAALAVAAAQAYNWDTTAERLSQVARLGAGSAARAVTGGVSEWLVEGERSFSRCMAGPDDFPDWRIVVPLVEHAVHTEGVHAEVSESPLFQGRLDYMPAALDAMRSAVEARDVSTMGAIAERDTLNLHAVTMTGSAGRVTWRPATVAVMETVRRLREDGVPVHFSIDTGATAYLNTTTDHEDTVARAVADIPGVADVLHLRPAGPAHIIEEHLF